MPTHRTVRRARYTLGVLDHQRWAKHHKGNVSLEDIAAEEGVSVKTIEKSIKRHELGRIMVNMQEMEYSQLRIIQASAELEMKALEGALSATMPIEVIGEDGRRKTTFIPDHAMRLRGVSTLNEKIASLRPKGPGIAIQNINGESHSAHASGGPAAIGMEERLRLHNARQQQALPAPRDEAEEAEYEDVEDGPDDGDPADTSPE